MFDGCGKSVALALVVIWVLTGCFVVSAVTGIEKGASPRCCCGRVATTCAPGRPRLRRAVQYVQQHDRQEQHASALTALGADHQQIAPHAQEGGSRS